MSESALAVSLLVKWILSATIGFAVGTLCARVVQQIGISVAKRRWEQSKLQSSGVQRSKLELERRRLLRTNPSLKLDTLAEVLNTLEDRDRSGRRVSWNYYVSGATTRKLRMQMRLVGISVGVLVTLLAYIILTLLGL